MRLWDPWIQSLSFSIRLWSRMSRIPLHIREVSWTVEMTQTVFAQTVIDFLSAPGKLLVCCFMPYLVQYIASTTTGKWGFSKSGRMVSKFHHNLSDKSIHAATVYSVWNNHGHIPKEAILQSIKAKHVRWQIEA